jgi:hypothetical protein
MDFVNEAWLQETPEPELKDTSMGNPWSTSRGKRILAERVGFEPTVEFPRHTLSKRAP